MSRPDRSRLWTILAAANSLSSTTSSAAMCSILRAVAPYSLQKVGTQIGNIDATTAARYDLPFIGDMHTKTDTSTSNPSASGSDDWCMPTNGAPCTLYYECNSGASATVRAQAARRGLVSRLIHALQDEDGYGWPTAIIGIIVDYMILPCTYWHNHPYLLIGNHSCDTSHI